MSRKDIKNIANIKSLCVGNQQIFVTHRTMLSLTINCQTQFKKDDEKKNRNSGSLICCMPNTYRQLA